MTAGQMQEARDRIDRLIPDGQSVLMSLSRTCSAAEWNDLREYYREAVAEFYAGFAIAWDSLPIAERQRVAERCGICWSRAIEISGQTWDAVPASLKRQLYRWLERAHVAG